MHVRKAETIIAELRVPIRFLGLLLLLHLGRVIVLLGDAPGRVNVPASNAGRGMGIAHASGGRGVHPSAVLPLLRIYSNGSGWHKGRMGSNVGNCSCRRSGVLHVGNDGGRGPG